MTMRTSPLCAALLLVFPAVFYVTAPLAAAEPAREFLKGLRERKYYDEAMLYLDQMAASTTAPIDLKETLLYEKGLTLVEAARVQRDPQLRDQYLNQARQMLQQFIGQRPDHALANAARSQLGNLIVDRARFKVEDSKKAQDAAKDALLAEARQLYDEGYKVFQQLQDDVRNQLERIPKVLDTRDRQQANMAERRTQLRADYLQTRLLAAAIREEMADTAAKGSTDYDQFLTEAADQYQAIYNDYRSRLAGLYARLYQGRCNQKLGKLRDALGYFSELLSQPDSPEEFRTLKTRTLKQAMECWLDPTEKKYVEAIKRGSDWIGKARPTEDREPDWLYLRLLLARAYQMEAEDAEQKEDERAAGRARGEARKLAQFVAKFTSDYQEQAQKLVAELGGPDRSGEKPAPQTFAEAQQAGRDALSAMQTASLAVAQFPRRIAQASDRDEKAKLEAEFAAGQDAVKAARQDALDYFRQALRLADEDTSLEDLNVARYFLCYVYYTQGDYYDAALMGDFIARRYPGSVGARPCANISLASYLKLYDENETEDKLFETERIISIAEYAVDKWPNQPEGINALNTLVPFMINADELDRAREFIDRMPANSPKRGEAELKLGQALWRKFLEGAAELRRWKSDQQFPEGVTEADKQAELAQYSSQAQEVLSTGFDRAREGDVDTTLMLGGLSLAQVYVDSQQPEKALAVLEDEAAGPLTLTRAGHAATQREGFAEETYKTALRAYISALGSGDASQRIAQAKQVMDELKEATGDAPEGNQRLIDIYVGLASDLEEQLANADDASKDALSQGFDAFLAQLSENADDLSILNWVAETYYGLGRSFDDEEDLTAKANDYYQKAGDAFANIAETVTLDDRMKTQVRMRQAEIKRRQRQFKEALDLYTELLRENPMMLNVQVDAAKAFQEWAAMPKLEDLYLRAIQGHREDEQTKKNIIWGWSRIALTTARYDQFQDVSREAQYNLALCRYRYAQAKGGAERDKWLGLAEKEISIRARRWPDMGGEPWRTRYDALLKQIQQAQGQPAVGLQKYVTATTADEGT